MDNSSGGNANSSLISHACSDSQGLTDSEMVPSLVSGSELSLNPLSKLFPSSLFQLYKWRYPKFRATKIQNGNSQKLNLF